MTEEELQAILKENPSLHVHEYKSERVEKPPRLPKPEKAFDSFAEELFYQSYITPLLIAGEITSCECHKSFEVAPEAWVDGERYRAKVYTPDFLLRYADGTTIVVEIKGKKIKKLQRDYQLRRHLFAIQYAAPNGWGFCEIPAEGLTQRTIDIHQIMTARRKQHENRSL